MQKWEIFLGGHDLEMGEIASLLSSRADIICHDAGLTWGAKASAYQAELDRTVEEGKHIFLVELADDLSSPLCRKRANWRRVPHVS